MFQSDLKEHFFFLFYFCLVGFFPPNHMKSVRVDLHWDIKPSTQTSPVSQLFILIDFSVAIPIFKLRKTEAGGLQ